MLAGACFKAKHSQTVAEATRTSQNIFSANVEDMSVRSERLRQLSERRIKTCRKIQSEEKKKVLFSKKSAQEHLHWWRFGSVDWWTESLEIHHRSPEETSWRIRNHSHSFLTYTAVTGTWSNNQRSEQDPRPWGVTAPVTEFHWHLLVCSSY